MVLNSIPIDPTTLYSSLFVFDASVALKKFMIANYYLQLVDRLESILDKDRRRLSCTVLFPFPHVFYLGTWVSPNSSLEKIKVERCRHGFSIELTNLTSTRITDFDMLNRNSVVYPRRAGPDRIRLWSYVTTREMMKTDYWSCISRAWYYSNCGKSKVGICKHGAVDHD